MTSAQLTQLLIEIGNLAGVIVAIYHAFGAKRAAQEAAAQPPAIQPGVPQSSPPPRP